MNEKRRNHLKFLKNNWAVLLTALFLIAVGILLLINPTGFTVSFIKAFGILLFVLGVYDMIKYFRADPMEGMKGSAFFSGLTLIAAGCFCFFKADWFLSVFPALAVIYGVFQILLGFRKVQRVVDALRLKMSDWLLFAVSAAVTLMFGIWITLNPEMAWISVWTFTGIALIVEGVLDLAVIIMQSRMDKNNQPTTEIGG